MFAKIVTAMLHLMGLVGLSGTPVSSRAVGTADQPACLIPHSQTIKLYQALLYSGKPDLTPYGFVKAHIVDRDIWVDEKTRDTISPQKLAKTVAALGQSGGLIVLDIENFPLTGDPMAVERSVAEMANAANVARSVAGPAKVGFYGLLPLSEYWRPTNDLLPLGLAAWEKDNRRLQPLDRAVDVNLPSLYTFYDDQPGWVKQARALVCEARKLSDKPVFAFVWPEFHPGSKPANTSLPPNYFRLQLEELSRIADGIVIWGGYDLAAKKAKPWQSDAAWWTQTQQFILEHRNNPDVRPISEP